MSEGYIFIISQFHEPSVNVVLSKLNKAKAKWVRFNTETYPMINSGNYFISNEISAYSEILIDGEKYYSENIKSVWYRRTGKFITPKGLLQKEQEFIFQESRSFLRSFLDTLSGAFWINNQRNELYANEKIVQLNLAKQVGFKIPDTLVSNNPTTILNFYHDHSRNVIFKPLAGSNVNPIDYSNEIYAKYRKELKIEPEISIANSESTIIFTKTLTDEAINSIDHAQYCPSLFQEYIDKALELRITVVGEEIFTCAKYSQEHTETVIDFRRLAKFPNIKLRYEVFILPLEIQVMIHKLMKKLGLVFGCIDMIVTPKGDFIFLEINPSGQWMWIETLTGLNISDAIVSKLISP